MQRMKRSELPFREKCEVFLLHKRNQVFVQDHKNYLLFAGGGVDPGENQIDAARREVLEETGARTGKLTYLATVDFVWFPEWASNAKRRERYAECQGERVHLFVGKATSLGKPTSTEGDEWTGKKTMAIDKCRDLMVQYGANSHPATYAYRVAQLSALNALSLLR
jgi:8-oxo-dGTP pyrophosphatase MutT (NUDIX family)